MPEVGLEGQENLEGREGQEWKKAGQGVIPDRPFRCLRTTGPYRFPAIQAFLTLPTYFAVMMKCPRRFCDQQDSSSVEQKGCSLPLLMTVTRLAGTPRLTR